MKEVKPVQEQKATTTTTGKGKQQTTKHAGGGAVAGRKISYCDCCCVRYYDLKKVHYGVLYHKRYKIKVSYVKLYVNL